MPETAQTFNFAASRPVNPPEATPKLTQAQMWRGLEMKARDPANFHAQVSSCDILSDTGDQVVRSVTFANGPPVREEISLYNGTILYCEVPSSGIRVTNVISYDADDALVLTMSFAGGVPGFSLPSKTPPTTDELNRAIGASIDLLIVRIRELVAEGEIQAI